MGNNTAALDSIAMNHSERKYNKVSAIVLKPDAERWSMIQVKPGSLKEGQLTGHVRCEVSIRAEDIESLYLAPLHRLT